MDVTSLNLIEKAEYVRPKSWAKEGIRTITVYASPLGRIYIDCELTDYSVIWYSNTKTAETVITKAILDVLMNTTGEPNREWYTAPLYKVLEATHTSWNTLHSFYQFKINLTPEGFSFESEGGARIYNSQETADRITKEILLAEAKANEPGVAMLAAELKGYTRDFEALLDIKDNNTFSHRCDGTVRMKSKRIEDLSFLIFSRNSDAVSAYNFAKKAASDVYNRQMTSSR